MAKWIARQDMTLGSHNPQPLRQASKSTGKIAALMLASTIVLTACSGDGWFGDSWFGDDDDPPLPGTRLTVLERERGLSGATRDQVDIILPAPEPNSDWPQEGGYAHHAMQHMVIGDSLSRAWSASIGSGNTSRDRILNGPVAAEGKVFAMDREAQVSAFDIGSGQRVWQVDLPDASLDEDDGALLGGGLAYDRGRLFATTGFAKVIALNAADGTELWRTELDAPMRAAPTVNSGRVIAITADNQVVTLAADDGRVLWTQAGAPEIASMLGASAAAIDQGIAIVPYSSGEIYALRLASGSVLWTDAVTAVRRTDAAGNLRDVDANPVIDGTRVIVMGNSGLLTALDLRSGRRAWQVRVAGTQQPWVAGNFLYILTEDSEIAAINAITGGIVWSTGLPRWEDPEDLEGPIYYTGPVLASDRLIVGGSDGYAYAVSPYSGEILGREDVPDAMASPPIIVDNTMLFVTTAGNLVAYR
ncbi:MAG: PQQ-binding-like beta-propeller repeat protein [Rhodospirillaceae bacterium]